MKALQAAYPGTLWKLLTLEQEFQKEWFFKYRYWTKKENQRKFFDSLAKKMHIKKPKDWGNIPTSIALESGGTFLFNLYKGSLFAALQSSFPGSFQYGYSLNL